MDHTYCVIMAGGKGERFWPLSADQMPKPFLKLMSDKTMIQLTLERLAGFVPHERVFVALGASHLAVARDQLPQLPAQNFLVEPEGRDTAPAIGFAAISLLEKDPGAIMVVVPADHYIPDVDRFRRTIAHGVNIARKGNYLVTIGIKPVRPETGYGYINARKVFSMSDEGVCFAVDRFVEKPDMKRAVEYLEEGNYYWNAGMFIWRAETLLAGIERHMPDLARGLTEIRDAFASRKKSRIGEVYRSFKKESIDYGLMEKADNVLMIPGEFRWDDVGTWNSLLRVMDRDKRGNYSSGETVCLDTTDSVVYGEDIPVGTIGVSNLVVVASKHGVLVCHGDRTQEVREIARVIEAKGGKRKQQDKDRGRQ